MTFNPVKKTRVSLIILSALLIVSSILAFTAGNYDISVSKLFNIVLSKITGAEIGGFTKTDEVIIWNIRFPRVLMAILAGAALSAAGATYQGCFRNPLVEPFILGASSGAAFGAALGIVFPTIFLAIQLSAFVFSMVAVSIAYFISRQKQTTPTIALILSGIIIGSVFGSFVSILKYFSEDAQLREITFWMMGGLHYSSWKDVAISAAVIVPCLFIMARLGWKLNVLSMGDEDARSLGVSPEKYKLLLIIIATLITAVSVSSSGIIAWVGLMTPHAARMIVGPDNRYALPAAALMGAIYLILCDTLARTMTQAEIPLGIITSIIGAPFLLWLIRNKNGKVYD